MRRADTVVDERPSPQVRQRLAWKPAAFPTMQTFIPALSRIAAGRRDISAVGWDSVLIS